MARKTPHGPELAGIIAFVATVLIRFAIGQHFDGKPRSDCTFHARGTQGPAHWFSSGRPSWWARLRGRERAAVWWTLVLLTYGMLTARTQTEWALALTLGPAAGLCYWRLHGNWQLRDHRTHLVRPLAAALAEKLPQDPATIARHHLKVRPDYTDAKPGDVIAEYRHLPDHWAGTGQRQGSDPAPVPVPHPGQHGVPLAAQAPDATRSCLRQNGTCVCRTRRPHRPHGLTADGFLLRRLRRRERGMRLPTSNEDPMVVKRGPHTQRKDQRQPGHRMPGAATRRRVLHGRPKRKSMLALRGVPGFHLVNDPR